MEDEARPWYAAGLYRRIQEARRFRPRRERRKPWRQRLRERGLHWSVELVVGLFVAVVAVSLFTVAFGTGGGTQGLTHLRLPSGGAAAAPSAPATPDCIAAPIAGSAKRVCAN